MASVLQGESLAAGAKQKMYTIAGVYNITGKDDDQVVEILKTVVNGEDYKTNAVFIFMIIPASTELQDLYTLQRNFWLIANPTKNQPGNGILYICQNGQLIGRQYGEEMVEDLEEMYDGDTSAFAIHLRTLFQTNETIVKYPFVTSEVYMLLLFEIGRRLVKDSEESSEWKKEYDKLPIKEAIQDILTLLGNKKCTFSDVFLPQGKFHCFTGFPPKVREKAIEEIKKALSTADGEEETESEIVDSLPEQVRNLNLQ